MGEAYRGLTIQIGADTSRLSKALSSTTNAINTAQSSLRLLDKALKLDPTSITTYGQKMDLLREKTVMLGKQYMWLTEEQSQLKAAGVDKLWEKAKNSVEGVTLQLTQAREQYNRINEALTITKDKVEALAAEFGVAYDNDHIEETIEAMRRVKGMTTAQYKATKQLRDEYRALTITHRDSEKAYETAKQVQAYDELIARIKLSNAEVKESAALYAKLRAEQEAIAGIRAKWIQNNSAIEMNNNSIRELESQAQRLKSAMEIDPYNLKTAELYSKNLKDQIIITTSKVSALRSQIETINSQGIRATGEDMSTLRLKADQSAEALQKIATKAGRVAGAIQKVDQQAADLAHQFNNDKLTSEQFVAEVSKLEPKLQRAVKVLAELLAKEKEIAKQSAFDKMRVDVEEFEVQVAEGVAKLNKLETSLVGVGNASRNAMSGLTSLGTTLSYTLSPAAMMGLMYTATWAKDVDSAYRDMRKTVDGLESQFEELKKNALEFSQTHYTSADQILEIEALGGQMGLAVEQLESFATVVANLDIATDLDAEDAALKIGQLANVMHMTTDEEFQGFGDALVRLGNNNAAMESSIMNVTSRIASMGTLLGMSTPQVLAWATAVAATGQGSESAGTAISKSFAQMESAVSKGGTRLEDFARISGMTVAEFKKNWESDASGTMKSFIEGLGEIQVSGGSVDATLQGLGITAVRQKQALEGLVQESDAVAASTSELAGTTGTLSNALVQAEEGWNLSGDAQEEADKKMQGFSGQLQLLMNSLQYLGVEFSEGLVMPLQVAIPVVQAVTKALEVLPTPIKTIISLGAVMTVGLGPLIRGMGAVTTALPKLKESISSKINMLERDINTTNKDTVVEMSNAAAKKTAININTMLAAAEKAKSASTEKDTTKNELNTLSMIQQDLAAKRLTISLAALKAANVALGALGAVVGIASLVALAATGVVALVEFATAEDELITKHKELMASIDDMDTMTDLSNALDDLVDEEKELTNEMEKNGDKNIDVRAQMLDLNAAYELSSEAVGEYSNALAENKEKQSEILTKLDETTRKNKALNKAYDELKGSEKVTSEYLDALNEKYGTQITESEYLTHRTQMLAKSKLEEADAEEEVSNAMDSILNKYPSLSQALADMGMDADEFSEILVNAGFDVSELGSQIESTVSKVRDGFSKMETDSEKTLSAFVSGFQSNVELENQYMDDLAIIAANGWASIDSAFFQKALTEGPETWGNMLHQVATSTDEETQSMFLQLVSDYENYGGEAAEKYAAALAGKLGMSKDEVLETITSTFDEATSSGDFEESGESDGEAYATGISNSKDKVRAAGDELAETAVDSISYSGVQSYWKGVDFASGYANGILSGKSNINSAVDSVVSDALKRVAETQDSSSPSKKTMKLGQYFGQGYGLGIESEYKYIRDMAIGASESALSSIRSFDTNKFEGIASDFASDIANVESDMKGNLVVTSRNAITKKDLFEAMSDAIANQSGEVEFAIYLDRNKVASTMANAMDAELGAVRRMGER